MFRGSKSNKSANYHTEMNHAVFYDWLKTKVFPELQKRKRKCVVVLDRANYHTELTPDTHPLVHDGVNENSCKQLTDGGSAS